MGSTSHADLQNDSLANTSQDRRALLAGLSGLAAGTLIASAAAAFTGNSGGVATGSTDPNANLTY